MAIPAVGSAMFGIWHTLERLDRLPRLNCFDKSHTKWRSREADLQCEGFAARRSAFTFALHSRDGDASAPFHESSGT